MKYYYYHHIVFLPWIHKNNMCRSFRCRAQAKFLKPLFKHQHHYSHTVYTPINSEDTEKYTNIFLYWKTWTETLTWKDLKQINHICFIFRLDFILKSMEWSNLWYFPSMCDFCQNKTTDNSEPHNLILIMYGPLLNAILPECHARYLLLRLNAIFFVSCSSKFHHVGSMSDPLLYQTWQPPGNSSHYPAAKTCNRINVKQTWLLMFPVPSLWIVCL